MPRSRTARYASLAPALALALAVTIASLSGCGSSVPTTGTAASPVNPEQADSQRKAMEDFTKTQKQNEGPGRRP